MKAKGLLEVTVLISGDISRRNRPDKALRLAKARAMKRRKHASVSPTTGEVGSGDGGEVNQQGERKEEKTAEGGNQKHRLPPHRLKLTRDLSRVPEEDSVSRASSSVYGKAMGSSAWDIEAGNGSGVQHYEGKSGDDQFLSRQRDSSKGRKDEERDKSGEAKREGIDSQKSVIGEDGAVDRVEVSAKIDREDSISDANVAAHGTINYSITRKGGENVNVKGECGDTHVASSVTEPGRSEGTQDAVQHNRDHSSRLAHQKAKAGRESRKSRGKIKSRPRSPLSEGPRIVSVDDCSEGKPKAAGRRSSIAALPSSPKHRLKSSRHLPRTPSRVRSTRRRSGKSRVPEAGDTLPTEPRRESPLVKVHVCVKTIYLVLWTGGGRNTVS